MHRGARLTLFNFTRRDIDHQLRKLVRIARALGGLCHAELIARAAARLHPNFKLTHYLLRLCLDRPLLVDAAQHIWNGISATYMGQHDELGGDGVRDVLERLIARADEGVPDDS